ncbi:hypothetical protein LZ31DRAFT_64163 [Colletotrichum somersetense]|nr:hypothetical protein LZ31DRAFT_64163 [Colletotrichum somersetense]
MGCLSSVSSLSCVVSCPSFFSCYCPSRLQSQGAVPFVSCAAGKRRRGERGGRERTWLAGGQANTADCPRACRISLIDSPPSQPPPILFGNGRRSAFRGRSGGYKGPGYHILPRIPKRGMVVVRCGIATPAHKLLLLLLPVFCCCCRSYSCRISPSPVSVSLSNLQAAPARSVGNSSTDQQGKGVHPTQAVTVVVVVVLVVVMLAGGRDTQDLEIQEELKIDWFDQDFPNPLDCVMY